MKIPSQRFIISILVFSFAFLPFLQAQAFIVHDPPHTVVTSAFSALQTASTAVTNFSVGVPGTGAATSASFKAGKLSCKALKLSLKAVDLVGIANISDATIGEGYGKITKMTTKYSALRAYKLCLDVFSEIADGADVAAAAAGLQAITSMGLNRTSLEIEKTDVNRKLDEVKAQLNVNWSEVWKAITVRLLMQAQQKITTNMVNELIQKYKISNYTQYANAVAGQVYNYQYLKQSSVKGKDQAIFRSLLPGGNGKKSALPLIKAKANEAFGVKADSISLDDPNFYQSMASKGMSMTNPSFQQYMAESAASSISGKAQAKASEEITANNGFKASWDCKDSSQQSVDEEIARLSGEMEVNQLAYEDLLSQYTIEPNSVDSSELLAAEEEYNNSLKAFEAYAEQQKDADSPCELLNPGSTIANSTNNYLSSHLSSTANLKEANLPFFAKFIESTASNLLNNIIGKSGRGFRSLSEVGASQVKVAASNVVQTNKATDTLKETFDDAQRNNIIFEGIKTGAEANEYKLQWDAENYVGADNATSAFVEVLGPLGLNKKFNDLKGSMIIGNPNGGTYTLKVTVNGQVVTVKTWVMPVAVNPSITAPAQTTIQDAINAAEDKVDEMQAILPPDTWVDPNPNTLIIDGGSVTVTGSVSSSSNSGSGSNYVQLCQTRFAGNQAMTDECITARGVGYVLGASTKMQILLREASGVAAKFFFLK